MGKTGPLDRSQTIDTSAEPLQPISVEEEWSRIALRLLGDGGRGRETRAEFPELSSNLFSSHLPPPTFTLREGKLPPPQG